MNPKVQSFFDNPQLVAQSKKVWVPFSQETYNNDIIVYSNEVHKISRKTHKVKKIQIQIGSEHMYMFKENSQGMVQLHIAKMEQVRDDFGTVLRISKNRQYVDILCDDLYKVQNILSTKILQTTFHEDFGVKKMIGKGSFAKVYLATKKSNNTQYAIKAFNKEFMADQFKGKESLENEIKVMRRLKHDNLVQLYESYETQNSLYFVLDVLKGGELFHRMKDKQISSSNLQKLIYNFMKALWYIHSKNCIHRDLKPENMLFKTLNEDTDIVIADFGLASFLNEEIIFKRCGTPGFVAPEILQYKEGDQFYDQKCDVYSAGIIIYFILTGRQPFRGMDYASILKANKKNEINYEIKEFKQASPNLQNLLTMMLKTDPKERISSEDCLKHPYFSDIFNEADLIDNSQNLANYEFEYLAGVQKKPSQTSSYGSMELQVRQAALNGNTDTVGSLSQYGNSITKFEQKQQMPLPQQSKFSQFSQNQKAQAEVVGSPSLKAKNNQTDLQKLALKNALEKQKNLTTKDDDYVNEEGTSIESAIQRLNKQSPKMGMLRKANSLKVEQ